MYYEIPKCFHFIYSLCVIEKVFPNVSSESVSVNINTMPSIARATTTKATKKCNMNEISDKKKSVYE